jgi:hypothetical protein
MSKKIKRYRRVNITLTKFVLCDNKCDNCITGLGLCIDPEIVSKRQHFFTLKTHDGIECIKYNKNLYKVSNIDSVLTANINKPYNVNPIKQ